MELIINSEKAGSQVYIRKRIKFPQIFDPDLRHVITRRCKKITRTEGKVGSTICREVALKVSVINVIREKINWMCCNLYGGQSGEGGRLS